MIVERVSDINTVETNANMSRPSLQSPSTVRFGFRSELLMTMYAVTDGFSGLTGSFGTPGSGLNFLVHNMCRLPGSGGSWMIVQGGMGAVARELLRVAEEAGVQVRTEAGVERVLHSDGAVTGVRLRGGKELQSSVVLCNADPFRYITGCRCSVV